MNEIKQMRATIDSPENYDLWSGARKAIARSGLWQFLLIAIGSASSIIYPHVPLVGFAAVSGATLNRKQAVIASTTIWFFNQFYGFTIREYPRTPESFTWGIVMGLGTLLVTMIATIKPKFSRQKVSGHYGWLAASVVAGYVLFQGAILLTAQLMVGDGHGLTVAILGRIFVKNVVSAIALSVIHSFLVWSAIKSSHQNQELARLP